MTDSVVSTSEDEIKSDLLRVAKVTGRKIAFIASDEFESMWEAKPRYSPREDTLPESSSRVRAPSATGSPIRPAGSIKQRLLSCEEEQHEFRRMNFLKFQANRLQSKFNPSNPALDVLIEIEQLMAESRRVRDFIIQANLGLVASNARKYCSSSYEYDELASDGSLALMVAVEKFNYQKGFRFSTYATISIRRSLFRKIGSRHIHRKRYALTDPDSMELAPEGTTSVDFDAPFQSSLADQVVQTFSKCLNDRERQIIECRFGLNDRGETQTLLQLSNTLGISKERVRQVEERALSKLRGIMA